MRLGILSDIHANREAFEAVLADLGQRGVGRIVILGDIVGYGADPEWCCDRATELVAQGAPAVMGNHDEAAAAGGSGMTATARRAIDWTRARLSDTQRAFLKDLPLTAREGDVLFVHASANDPGDWIYVTSEAKALPSFRVSDARVILCGHVHVPLLVSCDMQQTVRAQKVPMAQPVPLIRSRRWLAVVGSVGQPRDGVPQAGYAILDTDGNELTFRRVPYDNAGAAAKVRAAGLPEILAQRLMRGE